METNLLDPVEFVAATEAAETVTVEVAVPDPGVMDAGEKAQFRLLGTLLQESEIGLLKDPDCACAVSVKLPDCPGAITSEDGEAIKDKSDDDPAVPAQVELNEMVPVI